MPLKFPLGVNVKEPSGRDWSVPTRPEESTLTTHVVASALSLASNPGAATVRT